MAIKLNDNLEARGQFALVDEGQLSGSFRTVTLISDLNNIPTYARKPGMYVNVYSSGLTGSQFMLKDDLTTWIGVGSGSSGIVLTGSAGTYYSAIQVNQYGQVTSGSTATQTTPTPSLSSSYLAAVTSTDNILLLDRVRKGLTLKVNVPAFAEDPFSILSGSTTFLRVDASGNLSVNGVISSQTGTFGLLAVQSGLDRISFKSGSTEWGYFDTFSGNGFRINPSAHGSTMYVGDGPVQIGYTYGNGGIGVDVTTVSPNNDNVITLGGAGGRFWSNIYSYNYTIKPNGTLTGSAQAATNTTAMTIAPNVADGASSIGLLINPITTLASGKIIQIANAGTGLLDILSVGGIPKIKYTSAATALTMGSNILIESSGGVFEAASDNAISLGYFTNRWSCLYSYWYDNKLGATLPAASTITPTTGLHYASGSATVNTIATTNLPQQSNVRLTIVAMSSSFTWSAAGNIKTSGSIVQDTAQDFVYDFTAAKWYAVS